MNRGISACGGFICVVFAIHSGITSKLSLYKFASSLRAMLSNYCKENRKYLLEPGMEFGLLTFKRCYLESHAFAVTILLALESAFREKVGDSQ
jgi:hypothetical protein